MLSSHRSCILILCLIACCWPTLKQALAAERTNPEDQSETFQSIKKYDHRAYGSASDGEIYLEGIEDLDYLSYLSLRNYNLTDEGLLQSIRLIGLGTVLAPHKLHQIEETASVLFQSADKKTKLPLLLEAFISHLRNGRLKRMSLADIEATSSSLNLTEAYLELRQRRLDALGLNRSGSNDTGSPDVSLDDEEIRCIHLVTLYKFDLNEQRRIQIQSQQQSKVEYENGLVANGSQSEYTTADVSQEQQSSSVQPANGNAREDVIEARNKRASTNIELDESRLIRLCKLAIVCRSADELISLISKPWRNQARKDSFKKRQSHDRSQLERDASLDSIASSIDEDTNGLRETSTVSNQQNSPEPRVKPRNLRDSLSLSLAKLCPIILFPLHEDEGQCSLRRDDRPPMMTVWGFATLFVTIVCFCSLIGLSITPLLGHSATSESTTSSDLNEPLTGLTHDLHKDQGALEREVIRNKKQEHKASLTLFEGLAVGSLVGSALFSLIPQAFELQERESNHSFLLKAFIIFSGIYLFFCSERIMRIILDTRQMRKKKKRQPLHRSSTTAAMDGVIVEMQPQPEQKQRQQSSCCNRDHSGKRRADSRQPQSKIQISTTNLNLNDQEAAVPRKSSKRSKKIETQIPIASSPVNPPPKSSNAVKMHQQHLDEDARIKSDRLRPEQQSTSAVRQAIHRHKSQRRQRTNRSRRQMSSRNQSQMRQSHKQRSNRNQKESDQHQSRQIRGHEESAQIKRKGKTSSKRQKSKRPPIAESDMDSRVNSSSSASTSSSTSSFSSDTINRLREMQSGLVARVKHNEDSQLDYSFSSSSSSCSDITPCSSCVSFEHDYQVDSDEDNNQAKAVSKRMREFSRRLAEEELGQNKQQSNHDTIMMSSSLPQLRTTFKCGQEEDDHEQTTRLFQDGTHSRLTHHSSEYQSQRSNKQEISTVAWMIVLGDGLHNFIDGISIGAAFSESILSGVSISVAVICEEFPHELGDFAVLVSAGMTVRQALGYNFLSACTCYAGMAVGIILGDVTDGASYISALAAGVFLYIALVDMMGELSAALEESSRDSITRTLKLLLLQNVGIFIGISIIFVLSFIDF